MVFDTRTVDTMKESLAHYFEISCEELVEFIKEQLIILRLNLAACSMPIFLQKSSMLF